MKKKTFILFATLATICTSCKPPLLFLPEEENVQYESRQQLIFTHLWQRGDPYYKKVNDMIKAFNESEIAEELNVYVKGDGTNFWDYWTKVNLSISGGSAPDIFIHEVSSMPTRRRHLLNLSEMHRQDVKYSRDTLNAYEIFFESQIGDICVYSENQTDMYAWPFSATVRVVYYNKTLFEEAGITKTPTTWAEMEEASEKLTKYDDQGEYSQIGFDPFSAEGQYLHQWGWLSGHDYWKKDSKTGRPIPNFNTKEHIENFTKLYNSYVRRDDESRDKLQEFMSKFSANGQNPFVTGKLAMVINNEGLYTTLKEAKVPFEYGVFEIPPMNEDCDYVNWSSSYSLELYDNSLRSGLTEVEIQQRNRGSWEFMKYLYSHDPQKIISDAGFMIANKQYHDEFINSDPIKADLAKAIAHTKEAEYIAAVPKWTSEIQTYVNNIYSKNMTVTEAMNEIQRFLESEVNKYYATQG